MHKNTKITRKCSANPHHQNKMNYRRKILCFNFTTNCFSLFFCLLSLIFLVFAWLDITPGSDPVCVSLYLCKTERLKQLMTTDNGCCASRFKWKFEKLCAAAQHNSDRSNWLRRNRGRCSFSNKKINKTFPLKKSTELTWWDQSAVLPHCSVSNG